MAVACCHMTAHDCGLLSYDYTWPSTWPWLAVLPVIFDSKPYVCLAELQLQKAIKVPLPGVCTKALAGNLHEAKASK